MIDKYNLISNYSYACDQAFKNTTIISAFRKCGIWPLDESAVLVELFKPSRNYSTQAAQLIPAQLPLMLVPIQPALSSSSSSAAFHSTNSAGINFIYHTLYISHESLRQKPILLPSQPLTLQPLIPVHLPHPRHTPMTPTMPRR